MATASTVMSMAPKVADPNRGKALTVILQELASLRPKP